MADESTHPAEKVAAALEDHADELENQQQAESGPAVAEKRNFLASEFRKLAARLRGML